MKKQLAVLALSGALLVSTGGAFAQSYGPPPDHHDRAEHHRGMYEQGHRDGWYRQGGHVPRDYRGRRYVVSNWREYHLRRPPRGYHWVRSDNGDFLLVAISTGIIASILAHAITH